MLATTNKVAFMYVGKPFFGMNEFEDVIRTKGTPSKIDWENDDAGIAYYLEVVNICR